MPHLRCCHYKTHDASTIDIVRLALRQLIKQLALLTPRSNCFSCASAAEPMRTRWTTRTPERAAQNHKDISLWTANHKVPAKCCWNSDSLRKLHWEKLRQASRRSLQQSLNGQDHLSSHSTVRIASAVTQRSGSPQQSLNGQDRLSSHSTVRITSTVTQRSGSP